jgi:hypothetical protein
MLYDRLYTDVIADNYTHEQYYRGGAGYNYGKYSDKVYPVAN